MRVSILAHGVLDAASTLVDVLLAIVVTVAVVLAYDVGRRRWTATLRARRHRRLARDDAPRRPIGVPSWRPGPDADPATRALPAGTYGAGRVGPRYPEDPGRLL